MMTQRCRSILAVLAILFWAGAAGAADKAQPESYRLQPGDEITITVAPRMEYSFMGPIPPDGVLQLRNVGTLRAAGLTTTELAEAARKALEAVLKKPRVTVGLTKVAQPPKVTVSGAVLKAGPVPLEEGLRARKAIELAGGPVKEADLARVILLRKDLTRSLLDLSTEERLSDPAQNQLVQDGDSIEVPMKLKVRLTVVGGVTRPGVLEEVEAPVRLGKALELAGGALKEADLGKITITRLDLTRTVVDLSRPEHVADPAHNRLLEHGDSIEVPLLFKTGFATINGEVTKAGSYELRPGMTIEDLIVAAEKLSLVADVERVELQRTGKAKQVVNLLEQARQGVSGKVVLEPGDAVFVPKQENVVILVGALEKPGPRALKPGHTLRDFFTQGQPETQAALDGMRVDLSAVQLIRPGQETLKVNLTKALGSSRSKDNLALQSGDVIFLPAKEPKGPKTTVWDYLRGIPYVGSLVDLFRGPRRGGY